MANLNIPYELISKSLNSNLKLCINELFTTKNNKFTTYGHILYQVKKNFELQNIDPFVERLTLECLLNFQLESRMFTNTFMRRLLFFGDGTWHTQY